MSYQENAHERGLKGKKKCKSSDGTETTNKMFYSMSVSSQQQVFSTKRQWVNKHLLKLRPSQAEVMSTLVSHKGIGGIHIVSPQLTFSEYLC